MILGAAVVQNEAARVKLIVDMRCLSIPHAAVAQKNELSLGKRVDKYGEPECLSDRESPR